MTRSKWWSALVVAAVLGGGGTDAFAQGTTTGAISGTVTDEGGRPVAEAEIVVRNVATGYTNNALSRANGLYLVQGLEVGSNYTVTMRRIGYQEQERTNVIVTLGQATRVDFQVRTQVIALGAVEATATRTEVFSPTRQGVGTTVTDSLIRRVPNLARDFMDLVKLTPQVVRPQDGAGPSAGGQYNRFNSFTIDGGNQTDKFNLNTSGGNPGTGSGSKTISVEAIKEFRVQLTPTDVRHGNFTGMLVNAVTKNGTNEWTGGATVTYRDESLADTLPRKSPQSVQQYSFQLGGPIIRDRLHFFIAPEIQRRERPATGPFIGSSDMNIATDSVNAVIAAANGLGFDPGNGAEVPLENPTMNLFGRLDFAINNQHRAVFRQIYNKAVDDDFSRNLNTFQTSPLQQTSGFRLSSNLNEREHTNMSSVLQLFSNLSNGWSNEMLVGYNRLRDERIVPQQSPEISVAVVPLNSATATPTAAITLGTEQFSPNNLLKQRIFEVTENLTIPLGAHTMTVGGRFEDTNMYNNFAQRSFGVWIFPSIAAFQGPNRAPSGYALSYANSLDPADIAVDFGVQLYSFYAQDQWSVNPKLTVTAGIRGDMPRFKNEPPRNEIIAAVWDTIPGAPGELNTAVTPKSRILLSPRIGFNLDVFGNQRTQLRGNVGVFTGSPPYILLGNAFANTGLGLVTMSCTGANVPEFTTDVTDMPRACRNQADPAANASGTAGINTNDPDFKYPQSFTASAGIDHRLPWDVVMSVEGVYRNAINGLLIRDRNLRGPRMNGDARYTDLHGRVLYADSFSATGTVSNNRQRYITSVRGVSFGEGIIEVTNQSKDYNYTISTQLSKRFSPALHMQASYTYMQAKDIQSLTSDRAISNFRNGQQLSTAHSDLELGTSYFERPHRFVVAGTWTAPWKSTDISLFYDGQSGSPFAYVYSGDVNGDGVNANDPIYVPNDATNITEIRIGTQAIVAGVPLFTQNLPTAQRFNEFIDMQECLDEQRGQIMERNSCRSPWQNRMDLSIRQSVPDLSFLRGHGLALQLDVFNFLGMLNEDWGRIELPTLSPNFPQQSVLQTTGRSPGAINQSLPIVTFNSTVANINGDEPTIFMKGTDARNFYQMQLTLRWSF